MFDSLRQLFFTDSPEAAAVIFLIEAVTLVGLGWLAIQAVALRREWRLLDRVRSLFESDTLREAAPWDFPTKWTDAGGPDLPSGWVTDRVRGLMEVKAAGQGGAEALRDLVDRRAERQTEVPRYIAGTLVLLGLAGTVWGLGTAAGGVYPLLAQTQTLEQLQQLLQPMSTILAGMRTAFACTAAGLVATLGLSLLNLVFGQFQQALLLRLEALSATVLEPRILSSEEDVTAERFARLLEESSQRFREAVQPFAEGLDRFSERLRESADAFANRLENSSHNVLQSVEGMRDAAADLRQGAASLDDYYAKIALMYHNVEAMASDVARSQVRQQERLTEIAGGLHGITQSLTSVVASANETQAAVARVTSAVAGTADAVELSAERLHTSIDQLVAEVQTLSRHEREAAQRAFEELAAAMAAKWHAPDSNGQPVPTSSQRPSVAVDGVSMQRVLEQLVATLDGRLPSAIAAGLPAVNGDAAELDGVRAALVEVARSNEALQRTLDRRLTELGDDLRRATWPDWAREFDWWRRWFKGGRG